MKKQLHAVLNTLSDGVLITLAVLAAPCTVLTAYSVPYPLVALIFAAIGIGLCLSVWMHAHPFSFAAGILLYCTAFQFTFRFSQRVFIYAKASWSRFL